MSLDSSNVEIHLQAVNPCPDGFGGGLEQSLHWQEGSAALGAALCDM